MLQSFPYRLPLKKPLHLPGNEPIHERSGILIHNQQTGGWGDVAPLPGYSNESIADVERALGDLQGDLSGFPSLRFALECAAKPWQSPVADVFVNTLWIVDEESVTSLLDRIRHWHDPMVKIKPGNPIRLQSLLELVKARPDCRMRLDGNRQWSLAQTLQLFEALPASMIDYLEEPLSDPSHYDALWKQAAVPVALDESLLLPEGRDLVPREEVKALILKPTLMGNAQDRAPWITLAAKLGKHVVWSSCFESGVGIWHLARLAEGGICAGLDTAGIFTRDLVDPRPLSERGILYAKTLNVKVCI